MKTTNRKPSQTPLPTEWTVYAETENGREIRRGYDDQDRERYWVQPYNDNYWICTRSPEAALRAYYHPERYY